MKILSGKKFLITGVNNKFSIALGIANIMYLHGAELGFSYQNIRLKKKIKFLTKHLNPKFFLCCDVSNSNSIRSLFSKMSNFWDSFNGIIHCIAYVDKSQFSGDYLDVVTKLNFQEANNITSYSFVEMAQFGKNMLARGSVLLTISYLGSVRVVPFYNTMGVVKASLEANVRYIASSLGKKKIRVNAISSGPIKTTSSYSIRNFNKILETYRKKSPIPRLVTTKEIGNVASFLCSDFSNGITGQVIYVDNGFNIISF
ncbi:Enoyl-[acyl-carrier-protein] reductase [NADH] FabI [Buchnera aphidicola (Tetraneura ulmi)]|uniref:enoyl-ACP reductase FabI n=1 Tax=Buchnera aphidicola TaxID=9 RepID=UPI0034642390